MVEYEYSMKVSDVGPILDYCEKNGYQLVLKSDQNRIVYENLNSGRFLARMTTETVDGKTETVLDFKNVSRESNELTISKESEPLVVTESNRATLESMLEVLRFEKVADNLRTRYEYKKAGIKFEIDAYTRPPMNVVAIEGDKEKVDAVYAELLTNKEIAKVMLPSDTHEQ